MDTQKQDNRRVLTRRHLIYYLHVYNKEDGILLGHLVDLTTEGLMLVSEEPIEADQHLHLKMELPYDDKDTRLLEFEGDTCWCKPAVNPSFYDTGIKFSRLTLKKQSIITALIKEFGFNN